MWLASESTLVWEGREGRCRLTWHPRLRPRPCPVIVFIARSLDGYIADRDGGLDWLPPPPAPPPDDIGFGALMDEIDAVVMGRRTFETVLGFGGDWPYGKTVYVLSSSLREAPEALAGKVVFLRGSPAEVVAETVGRGHERLYVDGGATIQGFLRADLVDELRLTTVPVLLGGGAPLFGELAVPMSWRHVGSSVHAGGLVQDRYVRARSAS